MCCRNCRAGRKSTGFTLVELLVVISTICLLLSILLPSLGLAKAQARALVCLSNLKQIGFAVIFYTNDYEGYFPPAYEAESETHWWGQKLPDGIDHTKGFVWPYLQSKLEKKSVYECPSQPYGSYNLQAKHPDAPDDPKWITSTYGYNGYYLCPEKTAWPNISHRNWQKITNVTNPTKVFMFADTLLDRDTTGMSPNVENNALLDPPYLHTTAGWRKNDFPTTCFRHNEKTNVVFTDGHCRSMKLEDGEYTQPKSKIGSVGGTNAYYVPDYENWPTSRRRKK